MTYCYCLFGCAVTYSDRQENNVAEEPTASIIKTKEVADSSMAWYQSTKVHDIKFQKI
jgi:hypothetical protein